MKINKATAAVAGVVLILSFMLTLQFRSVRATGGANSTARARAEQLQTQLTNEQKKNEALYKQIIQYKDDLAVFSKQAEDSGGYAAILSQQLEQANLAAGFAAVEGPGVIVTLSDSDRLSTAGDNENNYIIHDEDLLKVINELWDAGAEAISINGERLIATSEIRCSGSTVSVNNSRYSAPYTIKAIGSAKELSDALNLRGGVVDSLAIWNIKCDISKQTTLTVEAYSGAKEMKYAKAVSAKEGGGNK